MKNFFIITLFFLSTASIGVLLLSAFAFVLLIAGGDSNTGDLLQWVKDPQVFVSLIILALLVAVPKIEKTGMDFVSRVGEKFFK